MIILTFFSFQYYKDFLNLAFYLTKIRHTPIILLLRLYNFNVLKEEFFMKKSTRFFAGLLAAAMVISAAGCGSSSSSSASTDESSSSTESSASSTTASTEAAAASGTTYKIGIVQQLEHPALDAASEGFMDALTDLLGEDNVEFDLQNAQGEQANCATISNNFVANNYDLILANATTALQCAAAATSSIPILGTSVTDYATALDIDDWSGSTGRNISGTSDLAPIDQQEAMLKELFPDAATVGILYCSAEPNSVYQAQVFEAALDADGIAYKEYTAADSNDIASVTQSAVGEVDVIYIPTDNTMAANTETINNIAAPAGIPIIAGEEGICEGCGVATLSISYYDIGYRAGEMAYEILVNGADITTMDVEYAPQVTKEYNADICDQLGISVPDDYVAIETE
jgi:putative ABC transport system substrate-binding protein